MVVRRVHRYDGSNSYSRERPGNMQDFMNAVMSHSERVTAVVKEDQYWYIFTDDLGLGKVPLSPVAKP